MSGIVTKVRWALVAKLENDPTTITNITEICLSRDFLMVGDAILRNVPFIDY